VVVVPFQKRSVTAALVGFLIGLAGSSLPAAAQGVIDERYRALYDEAFKATYENPGDLQAVLTFAKVAALAGDLEGAIGALERVLIFNPDVAEVQFQLGQLYRALGSYDAARLYLQRADPAQLSADDRAARERSLAALDQDTSRHHIGAFVTGGLRYQTNANAGPSNTARAFGGSPTATSQGAKPDTNGFAGAVIGHSYDLGDQAGTSWDTRMTLYGTRQFHRHLLNVALVEIDTGPRFKLGTAQDGSPSLRPYVLGNAFELGGSEYFATFGAGGNAFWQPSTTWGLDGTFEVRNLGYNNTSTQPSATNKDATQQLLRGVVSYLATANDLISATVQGVNYDARTPFETFQELTLSATYVHRFAAPWTWSEQPWAVSASAGHVGRPYAGGDPSITRSPPPPAPPTPPTRRVDSEWDLGGALTIGLTENAAFRFDVQQVWAGSNVALYDYRNTAVLGTLELRF
jgi:hypothetical protein